VTEKKITTEREDLTNLKQRHLNTLDDGRIEATEKRQTKGYRRLLPTALSPAPRLLTERNTQTTAMPPLSSTTTRYWPALRVIFITKS
jgi:hypothetical protein